MSILGEARAHYWRPNLELHEWPAEPQLGGAATATKEELTTTIPGFRAAKLYVVKSNGSLAGKKAARGKEKQLLSEELILGLRDNGLLVGARGTRHKT